MATVLTEKHQGLSEVWGHYALYAVKALGLITGGIGGLLILAFLLFPFLLMLGFLLKAIGF